MKQEKLEPIFYRLTTIDGCMREYLAGFSPLEYELKQEFAVGLNTARIYQFKSEGLGHLFITPVTWGGIVYDAQSTVMIRQYEEGSVTG